MNGGLSRLKIYCILDCFHQYQNILLSEVFCISVEILLNAEPSGNNFVTKSRHKTAVFIVLVFIKGNRTALEYFE